MVLEFPSNLRPGIGFALLLGLSACGPDASPTVEPDDPVAVVRMTDTLQFEPAELRVPAGSRVRFENTSVLSHTVTADPSKAALVGSAALPAGAKAFDSGVLDPGASYEHVFDVAGTFGYFCMPHEAAGMRGRVIVTTARHGP